MTDIVDRLREAFTADGECDFDTLKMNPRLRHEEDWQQSVAASDAADEIERLRGLIQSIRRLTVTCNGV